MGFSLFLVGVICCVLHKISFDLLIIYLCMYVFIVRQCKVENPSIELITLGPCFFGRRCWSQEKKSYLLGYTLLFFFPGTSQQV